MQFRLVLRLLNSTMRIKREVYSLGAIEIFA